MGTETAAEASGEGVRPEERDRCVQRTVDLSDAEIAAVTAAEMTSPPEPRHASTKLGQISEVCCPAFRA